MRFYEEISATRNLVMMADEAMRAEEVEGNGYIAGVPCGPGQPCAAYVRVIYFPNWNDEDRRSNSTCWATPRTNCAEKQAIERWARVGGGRETVFYAAEPAPAQGESICGDAVGLKTGRQTPKDAHYEWAGSQPVMDASADGKKICSHDIQPAVRGAIDAKAKTVGWPNG